MVLLKKTHRGVWTISLEYKGIYSVNITDYVNTVQNLSNRLTASTEYEIG